MSIASKYWQFVGFNAAGQRRVEVLETAKQFFVPFVDELTRQYPQKAETDGFIQRQLWDHVQENSDRPLNMTADPSPPSVLCLRCCVSHLIEQSCYQLSQQFGQAHQFEPTELMPLVLDANARLALQPQAKYESLSIKILQNFDPRQGNLATWTIRLVRNDRRINEFLLEHGVYLISDWAILNDSRPPQVERILLEFHHQTPFEAKAASHLLRCYHSVYRGDRVKANAKGRCHEPNLNQLQRIQKLQVQYNPPSFEMGVETTVLVELKQLAALIREYRITKRGGPPKLDSIDAVDARTGAVQQIAAPQIDPYEQEQDEFLSQYHDQLKSSLDEAIEAVINRRLQSFQIKRNPGEIIQSWLKGLHLFHCCRLSMGEIAEEVGLKAQYQVSRLLQLKAMRTEIRQELLTLLQGRVRETAQRQLSYEQLQQLDMQLEAILSEQIDDLFSQAMADVGSVRPGMAKSLFTERLCVCLNRRLSP
ncbi:MAG: hypothetical protein AAGB01_06840 [Cyanobacteria bacterium P01_F01_bin.42]